MDKMSSIKQIYDKQDYVRKIDKNIHSDSQETCFIIFGKSYIIYK